MSRVLAVAIAAAVAIAGCAHAPRPAQSLPGAAYTFTLVRGGAPEVEIALAFAGAADGRTTLAMVPTWGGIDHPADGVRELAVRDGRGAPLAVTRAGDEWHVTHAPGAALVVTYRLRSPRPLGDESDSYYRPIVTAHLVHLIGETALVYPRHLDDDRERPLSIAWRGFDAGWQVVSSLGVGDQRVRLELGRLRSALFIASDELHLLPRDVDGQPLMLGLVGDWPHGEALADLAARIVAIERRFFSDRGPPFFLISLIPLPGDRCSSRGGTGLLRSFALFMSQPCRVDGADPWLPHLLAHELFHGWNPRTDGEPEGLSYWFSEGFTDFYARRLMYRAGVLPLDGYVAALNEALQASALSPARAADNERVRREYWKSRDVEKVPYWRGDLVALAVDTALRRRGRSLDELYRRLVRDSDRGAVLDSEKLLARLAHETDAALGERLRRTIVDGAPLEIDASSLSPCLARETVRRPTYDLGLDGEALIERHEIRGVRPGSNAARAGLRDGATLAGMSLSVGDIDHEVEIRVREDGTTRTMRYFPHGEEREVVRFAIGDAAACAAIL